MIFDFQGFHNCQHCNKYIRAQEAIGHSCPEHKKWLSELGQMLTRKKAGRKVWPSHDSILWMGGSILDGKN